MTAKDNGITPITAGDKFSLAFDIKDENGNYAILSNPVAIFALSDLWFAEPDNVPILLKVSPDNGATVESRVTNGVTIWTVYVDFVPDDTVGFDGQHFYWVKVTDDTLETTVATGKLDIKPAPDWDGEAP